MFESLVGDDNERIDILAELANAFLCLTHAAAALKYEGLGNDGDREDIHLLGYARYNGSGSGSRTAAHTGGNEHHVGACKRGLDLLGIFLGGALTDLGVCTRAVSACDLFTYYYLIGSV